MADTSHEISFLIFFLIIKKMSSAAVVIGALRVNLSCFHLGVSGLKKLYLLSIYPKFQQRHTGFLD